MATLVKRPAIAGSVILIDSAAPTGLKTPESHYPILEACRTNRELMGKSLAGAAPTLKDAAMLGTIVDEAMLMAPLAFSGNARALERMDYAGKLSAYKGRVLVIWGRKDLIVNEAMARETVAAFKDASLEILDDVGHSVMVESPADFKRLVSSFLNAER
jgi:pimeloyl-ACP methyl ester carboxylesterase